MNIKKNNCRKWGNVNVIATFKRSREHTINKMDHMVVIFVDKISNL